MHTFGRPIKYTQEFLENEAKALIEWSNSSEENIFIYDFCKTRDYSRQRIPEFIQDSDVFAEAYKDLLSKQENIILKKALKREYSDSFSKFLLINNFDYISEKSRSQVENLNDLKVEIINYAEAIKNEQKQ